MIIAVIGLGNMGRAIAQRLAASGVALRVWNRSSEKAAGLPATVCASPAEAARGADLAVTSLANDAAVRDVVFGAGGLLDGLGGAVHVGISTISHAFAGTLARAHAERGQDYVSAPVVGRPDAAASGKLFVYCGGPEAARRRCAPLFNAIARGTFELASAPEANLAKIQTNLMLAATIELLGEVMALGEKGGIAAARTVELLAGTLFGCPAVEVYGPMIAHGAFEPAGFRMALGLKDVELALAAGDELRVPLPTASIVRDRLLAALAQGLEHLDWSGLTRIERAEAGLDAAR